ncbi:OTU (ovarian tumor)-like cysteine protease [Ceraceosorus bombacis]|uniref:OTU (Ovarian tumor)-like cysteine protease n=1 Tax=Ceraceosorus bombacis TaxID=401625 RepID=A0A0P1BID6_9BASI|nr:OTU (ovarian tumor)-like cysteine protease [Ceraceosorus bombacis]
MAGGKKKVNRHTPSRNDSTRADIDAAQRAGAVGEDDEGFDIAADLLATLDARDAAADAFAADTHDANVQQTSGAIMGPKIGRQKARLARRDAEQAALRAQAELELKANGGKPDEAERERAGMADLCSSLGREMVEINPDGHCLYAAVADQLHTLGKVHKKVDFRDTRKATAEHMRANATEFIPFISDSDEHMAGINNDSAGTQGQDVEQRARKHFLDYCDAVENTGVWGGQPEILALSRAYKTQIHVVQVGSPTLKVGEGEHKGEPCVISYHRKMYGLGEHYNSLRKVKK